MDDWLNEWIMRLKLCLQGSSRNRNRTHLVNDLVLEPSQVTLEELLDVGFRPEEYYKLFSGQTDDPEAALKISAAPEWQWAKMDVMPTCDTDHLKDFWSANIYCCQWCGLLGTPPTRDAESCTKCMIVLKCPGELSPTHLLSIFCDPLLCMQIQEYRSNTRELSKWAYIREFPKGFSRICDGF